METRNILDAAGNVVGTLTLPAGTSEAVWAEKLAEYTQGYAAWLPVVQPVNVENAVALSTLTDDDDALMSRPKYAPPGWSYQLRSMEFETSKRASIRCKKVDPLTKVKTDWGDVTLKFFDAEGAELIQGGEETDVDFQTRLDGNCVWTQVDFEPAHDMEVIGGSVRLLVELSTDVYLTIVGVPDVPEASGGTKYFVADVNLNYIPTQGAIEADGRTSKRLDYSNTLHTNKMRALFEHAAGVKHRVQLNYEFYRS